MHNVAAQLLGSGASINDTMARGQTLLHMAIQRQDSKSALFLLEHQADINVRYVWAAGGSTLPDVSSLIKSTSELSPLNLLIDAML